MEVRAEVVKKKSNKTGQPYAVLEITFPNGYVMTQFLTDEQLFIIELNKGK